MTQGDKAAHTLPSVSESWFRIEHDLNLMELDIAGVRLWERLRFPLHLRALRGLGVYDRVPASRSSGRIWLGRLWRAMASNPWRVEPARIVFVGTPRRKLGPGGDWWDVYCDPVMDHLRIRARYMEPPSDRGHRRPTHTPQVTYEERLVVEARLDAARHPVKMTGAQRDAVDAFEASLHQEFGLTWNLGAEFEARAAMERAREVVYGRWLQRVRPDLVVLVCSYGKEALVAACRERGIATAELQHGTIHRYHLGYSFPQTWKRDFPDHFLAFGRYWIETVPLPLPGNRVYAAGYPYFDQERGRYEGTKKTDAVLFLSQPTIGLELAHLAHRFSDLYPGTVVFKLHPTEVTGWRARYPFLDRSRVRVKTEEMPSLYERFASARAQVGVYSTALYEGIGFGLPTYLLDTSGVEYMEELIGANYATLIRGAEELVEALDQESRSVPPIDRFFRRDSLERVPRLIEELAGGS